VTLLLRDPDVRAVCDIGSMVAALEDGLRKEAKGPGAILPERVALVSGENFLRVMPALLPEAGLMGLKFFHGSMRDGVRYVIAVCRLETGVVEAIVDSAYLTGARTGATSGVATKQLAREDSTMVGLIGSGLEAETNLRAVCSVRPITHVKVYSRNPERRAAFAARLSGSTGITVVPAATPQEAVAGVDIVVVATNTGPEPVVAFQGAWLEAGQHVVSIGSTTHLLREIDVDTILRADVVVHDAAIEQIGHESGDFVALLEREPGWAAGTELGTLLSGAVTGRTSPSQITLFKSVGTAAQDLLAAMHVVREARAAGVGTEVDEIASPKQF
jgi:alanine dehydrogenase